MTQSPSLFRNLLTVDHHNCGPKEKNTARCLHYDVPDTHDDSQSNISSSSYQSMSSLVDRVLDTASHSSAATIPFGSTPGQELVEASPLHGQVSHEQVWSSLGLLPMLTPPATRRQNINTPSTELSSPKYDNVSPQRTVSNPGTPMMEDSP